MIIIKYVERNTKNTDTFVFYSYKEFFKFWRKYYREGDISLISCSTMEGYGDIDSLEQEKYGEDLEED